jgi:hypothetical protein
MKATRPRVIVAVDPHQEINAVNVVDSEAVVLAREAFDLTASTDYLKRWPGASK